MRSFTILFNYFFFLLLFLYFFLYLGHFLRTEHYHKQKNETITDKTIKGLAPYEVFQYEKGKLNKIYSEGSKYWKHCISYLLLAL